MLTIFAIPKPFEGHIGTIQRNAIGSWKRLRPECQVIICGDEPGSREAAAEFGIDHVPEIARNEFGTPLLSSAFHRATERASHDVLCYVNADLILLTDFLDAAREVSEGSSRFLMVGQTWNVEVTRELVVNDAEWENNLRQVVAQTGTIRPAGWIDYFVYPRGMFDVLPDFAVGRPSWDNWMIYQARKRRFPVVDASHQTLVIHQQHGYGHVKKAAGERWEGPEAELNGAIVGIPTRGRFTIDDATHTLTSAGIVRAASTTGLLGCIRGEARVLSASEVGYHVQRPFHSLRQAIAFRTRLRRLSEVVHDRRTYSE